MSDSTRRKVALIGGGGVRTPLVVFGLSEAAKQLGVDELCLYDADLERARIMAAIGEEVIARDAGSLRLRVTPSLEDAVDGAAFVLSSIRVGGIESRAADERMAVKHHYPGQETTGPAGVAMALRTVPVVLEHARIVERHSPDAWLINFTNPAGLITQAISDHTSLRVIGICDTPTELFHRIALALNAEPAEVRCEYVGLNHLGWVRRVWFRGEDALPALLSSDRLPRVLFADLFAPDLIRALGMLPTEYLFFYYSRRRALKNQKTTAVTRGEEISRLNETLLSQLAAHIDAGDSSTALAIYIGYLNQRSGSYMKLEASGGSAFDGSHTLSDDPFRAATGYHRIALDVMKALSGDVSSRLVVNTRNRGAISDMAAADIVEVPCSISKSGVHPELCGALPESVRGLVLATKAYEKAAIAAAVDRSPRLAQKAMLLYPAISDWESSVELLGDLLARDRSGLGYLRDSSDL